MLLFAQYGYKNKGLKIPIRNDPYNRDQDEQEPALEPAKPKVDFIKRNRQKATGKAINSAENGDKPGLRPLKKDKNGVTLTQKQLNAILASVGQVATGKEDNVRISIGKYN